MEVNDVRDKSKGMFCELDCGDIFLHAGIYYMRIEEIEDCYNQTYNAVNVEDGTLVHMYEDDTVEGLIAQLRITG